MFQSRSKLFKWCVNFKAERSTRSAKYTRGFVHICADVVSVTPHCKLTSDAFSKHCQNYQADAETNSFALSVSEI